MSKVLKNTYYSSISIYFEYFLGLIVSILIARTLGVDAFGIYSYMVKIAGVLIVFTNAGISIGAIKFIAEARALDDLEGIHAIHNYFRRIQLMKTALICLCVAFVALVFPSVLIESEYQHLVVFLMLVVIFKSSYMYRVGVLKGFERFDYLAFIVLIVAPVNLGLVFMAYTFEANVTEVFGIFSVIALMYWAVSQVYLKRLVDPLRLKTAELDPALKVRINHHLRVVTINTVLGVLVLGQCEVIILKHFSTNESVAFFNIATVMAGAAISLVPGVYSFLLLPMIAKSVSGSKEDPAIKISEAMRYLFVLGVMVAVPSLVYGELIVTILYGEEYAKAGLIFGLFTLVGVLTSFRDPINAYLLSADRQSLLLKFSIFSLVMSLSLNLSLITIWKLDGAVAAYCLLSVILTALLYSIVRRYLDISPDFKRMAIALLSSLLAIAISYLISNSMEGVLQVFIGFFSFGVSYLAFLLILNGLSEDDYDMVIKVSKRFGKKASSLVKVIVAHRIRW